VERLLLATCLAGVGGCEFHDPQVVRTEFLSAHPGAAILGVIPEGSDADHVYYQIRYRPGLDSSVRQQTWGYQRTSDDRWHLFYRDSVP
jgi:hypothetical protein